MKLVKIGEKEFPYTFGMGALVIYETLTGRSFSLGEGDLKTEDLVAIHYACLCNGSADFSSSVAEFIRVLDEPEPAEALKTAFLAELERWRSRNSAETDGDDKNAADDEDTSKKK